MEIILMYFCLSLLIVCASVAFYFNYLEKVTPEVITPKVKVVDINRRYGYLKNVAPEATGFLELYEKRESLKSSPDLSHYVDTYTDKMLEYFHPVMRQGMELKTRDMEADFKKKAAECRGWLKELKEMEEGK